MRFSAGERCWVAKASVFLKKTGILFDVGADPELPVSEQQTGKEISAAVMLLGHVVHSRPHLHTSAALYLLHLPHAIRRAREVKVTKPADILSKLSAAGDEMLRRRCYRPCELWKHFRKHEWLAPSGASSETREPRFIGENKSKFNIPARMLTSDVF